MEVGRYDISTERLPPPSQCAVIGTLAASRLGAAPSQCHFEKSVCVCCVVELQLPASPPPPPRRSLYVLLWVASPIDTTPRPEQSQQDHTPSNWAMRALDPTVVPAHCLPTGPWFITGMNMDASGI